MFRNNWIPHPDFYLVYKVLSRIDYRDPASRSRRVRTHTLIPVDYINQAQQLFRADSVRPLCFTEKQVEVEFSTFLAEFYLTSTVAEGKCHRPLDQVMKQLIVFEFRPFPNRFDRHM